jgi:hypothetical protein
MIDSLGYYYLSMVLGPSHYLTLSFYSILMSLVVCLILSYEKCLKGCAWHHVLELWGIILGIMRLCCCRYMICLMYTCAQ